MSIAILGGSGFIGTRLFSRLNQNNFVVKIFDKVESEAFGSYSSKVNICDIASLSDALENQSAIINLAAEHRDDVCPKSLYDEVNVQGASNICAAARANNINKLIFTSSVAIYGFAPPNTDETGEINYFNDYGRTKYQAEQIYKAWYEEDSDNRTLVIVRPTVIFGEANRGNVYNLLKQIASKRFVMFGNGKNKKSMAYVENVVAFIEYSLAFKPGLHIYNYIDKPDLDMNTLVSTSRKVLFGRDNVGLRLPAFLGIGIGYIADFISRVIRKNLPVSSIRVKKFMATTQFDSATKNTGFSAPVKLNEALATTLKYEFLEDNSDRPTFDTQ